MSAQELEERKLAEMAVIQILGTLFRENNHPAICDACDETIVKNEKQPEPVKQQLDSPCKQSECKPPALKYLLRPEIAGEEFYECTECGERRIQNSFFCDHSHHPHKGKKPYIKWFCPLCKKRFSTSYRSGHLMKAHADFVIVTKRERFGEEEPASKRARIYE